MLSVPTTSTPVSSKASVAQATRYHPMPGRTSATVATT
jgi:hypothetical protein